MAEWFRGRWEIWSKPREGPSAERFLPFDEWALYLYRLGFWLAPSWLFIDAAERWQTAGKKGPERSRIIRQQKTSTALYVAVWCAVLFAIWLLTPENNTIATAAAIIAIFRLFEIALTILGFVLDQREPQIAGSLITIGLLGLQVVFIFAILDNAFAHDGFLLPGVDTNAKGAHPAAATQFEYLYLSWTYMITIGNEYTPDTGPARFLQIATTSTGIVLLGIVAARAIGLVGSTEKIVSGLKEKVANLEGETDRLEKEIRKRD